MKFAILKTTIALCLITTSSSVLAKASDGVVCSGTTASYSGNKVLKCYTNNTRTYRLGSMCPPARYPLNIVMNSRGRDTCSAVIAGNKVTSAKTPPLPGYPPHNQFRRVISQNGVDSFVARVTSRNYKHPRGKRYLHNARKGVTCPSGYTSKYARSRLKCEKKTVRRATCDIGWSLDRRSGRDVCQMRTLVGTITGEYTIPEGTTGALGHPRKFGWRLEVKNGRDNWYKVSYKYPKAAR